MPKAGAKLSDAVIADFAKWISSGAPDPRLLGAFDPLLLGWTSRELILGPHTHLVTLNGIFKPFALVKGRAVGTWKLNRGKVTVEPLGKVSKAATAALAADAADVERFMASA